MCVCERETVLVCVCVCFSEDVFLLHLHFNDIREETVAHGWRAYQTGRLPPSLSNSVSLGITALYEVFSLAWLGFNKT